MGFFVWVGLLIVLGAIGFIGGRTYAAAGKRNGERNSGTLIAFSSIGVGLRAAFAVYFLEQGGDKYDLQLLMGHASGATTDVYARRLDKQQRMRSVLNLDWQVAVLCCQVSGV